MLEHFFAIGGLLELQLESISLFQDDFRLLVFTVAVIFIVVFELRFNLLVIIFVLLFGLVRLVILVFPNKAIRVSTSSPMVSLHVCCYLRFAAASSSSDLDFFLGSSAVFFSPQRADTISLHVTDHPTATANKLLIALVSIRQGATTL